MQLTFLSSQGLEGGSDRKNRMWDNNWFLIMLLPISESCMSMILASFFQKQTSPCFYIASVAHLWTWVGYILCMLPFVNIQLHHHSDRSISTLVDEKPTHTNKYLDFIIWNILGVVSISSKYHVKIILLSLLLCIISHIHKIFFISGEKERDNAYSDL